MGEIFVAREKSSTPFRTRARRYTDNYQRSLNSALIPNRIKFRRGGAAIRSYTGINWSPIATVVRPAGPDRSHRCNRKNEIKRRGSFVGGTKLHDRQRGCSSWVYCVLTWRSIRSWPCRDRPDMRASGLRRPRPARLHVPDRSFADTGGSIRNLPRSVTTKSVG
jgi:hypothetical protein